ncbi:TniB family NTP-binding protein [Mesorhizobium sp.]|uniref:TniB family NTP-binding protein n=1 Tax=Mesorhizobium sp. TaxID=1871066 RepID=UPI000FE97BAB|nr:TniB family NTP-binding protein [Mesorhizobium sp.]RWM07952.1 MAG: hypothetical protein EOR71_14430 [Mesorhizobium sp.]
MPTPDALVMAKFQDIRIWHPRMDAAHDVFKTFMDFKGLCPHAEQPVATMFSKSHCGKSTTVEHFLETTIADELIEKGIFPPTMDRKQIARKQTVAPLVTLTEKSTPRTFYSDALFRLGDPAASRGTAQALQQRLYHLLGHHRSKILFIDELQHLCPRGARYLGDGSHVTDAIKTMSIRGLVPIILVGTDDVLPWISNSKQLQNRSIEDIECGPLDIKREDERTLFYAFCGKLGIKLRELGVFSGETNLLCNDIPIKLAVSSGGIIGICFKIVRKASILGLRKGQCSLHYDNLSEAVERWAIPRGHVKYNPFTEGVRRGSI